MAIVNVTPGEFGDFVMVYLLDKVLHPDEVSKGNELFDDAIKELTARGAKPTLTKYYLNVPSQMRFDYRRIKDVFEGKGSVQQIRIEPEKETGKEPPKGKEKKKEKEGIIKKGAKAIKKALKKLISQGPESLSGEEIDMINEWLETKGDEIL
jgi:hypothetical protein